MQHVFLERLEAAEKGDFLCPVPASSIGQHVSDHADVIQIASDRILKAGKLSVVCQRRCSEKGEVASEGSGAAQKGCTISVIPVSALHVSSDSGDARQDQKTNRMR